MTPAEGYIAVCKAYLPELPVTQVELRVWWSKEAGARRDAGLTTEQEDELAKLCRTMLWQLPEGEAEPDRKPEPRKPQSRPTAKRRYGTV